MCVRQGNRQRKCILIIRCVGRTRRGCIIMRGQSDARRCSSTAAHMQCEIVRLPGACEPVSHELHASTPLSTAELPSRPSHVHSVPSYWSTRGVGWLPPCGTPNAVRPSGLLRPKPRRRRMRGGGLETRRLFFGSARQHAIYLTYLTYF